MGYKNAPVRDVDVIKQSEYISIAEASLITGIPAETISDMVNQKDVTYVLRIGTKGVKRLIHRVRFLEFLVCKMQKEGVV